MKSKGVLITTLLAIVMFVSGVAAVVVNDKKGNVVEMPANEASIESSAEEVSEASIETSQAEVVEETADAEDDEEFEYSVTEEEDQLTYQYETLVRYGADEKYLEAAKLNIGDAESYFEDFMTAYKNGDPSFLDYVDFEDEFSSQEYGKKVWADFFNDSRIVEFWKIMTSTVEIVLPYNATQDEIAKQPLFYFNVEEDGTVTGVELNYNLSMTMKDYYILQNVENAFARPSIKEITTMESLKEEFLWADEKIEPGYYPLFFKINPDLTYTVESNACLESIYGEERPENTIDYSYTAQAEIPQNILAMLDHSIDDTNVEEIDPDNTTLSEDVIPYVRFLKLCKQGEYEKAMEVAMEYDFAGYTPKVALENYQKMSQEDKDKVDALVKRVPVCEYSCRITNVTSENELYASGYATRIVAYSESDDKLITTTEYFFVPFLAKRSSFAESVINAADPFTSAVTAVMNENK